jgi:hypothetical protein
MLEMGGSCGMYEMGGARGMHEMGGACGMYEKDKIHTGFWEKNLNERQNLEDISGMIILIWISNTGFSLLRIGTCGRLL